MIIKNILTIDLVQHSAAPQLDAMQNDANSRAVEISLSENGSAWLIPEGVTAAIAYSKPDGTRGLYDTMPDSSPAWSISGSKVAFSLAPQMLTVPGMVQASVILVKDAVQLSTFPLHIRVESCPGSEIKSEDYYSYTTFAALNAALGNLDHLETETRSSLVAAVNELAQKSKDRSGTVVSVNGIGPDENGNVQIELGSDTPAIAPTIQVKETADGVSVYITDTNGTSEAFISHGSDGYTPIKGVDYFDGAPGKDGVSPMIKARETAQGVMIDIYDNYGETTVTVPKGADGSPGASVSITNVTETAEDGGSNVITFSDGKTLAVRNGNRGTAGTTPVKGTDYFTAADKAEIVNAVISALPVYAGEVL